MRRALSCAVAALFAAGGSAYAQQVPVPVPPPSPYGQWSLGQIYVRGDAGGAFSAGTDLRSTAPYASDSLLGPGARLYGNTGNSGIFDVGVGARLLPWARWDATLSYLPAMKLTGSGNSAHLNSWVGMVNGYLDLAGLYPYAFGPLQPYLDAGIGAASNTIDTMSSSSLAGGTAIGGGTTTSLAVGIGAGVAYPVAPNVTLDLAYRYLTLGEVRTGDSDTAGAIAPLKARLDENTVTLGLRYSFF